MVFLFVCYVFRLCETGSLPGVQWYIALVVVCHSVSGARLLLFGQEGEALQALLTLLLKDIVQFCAKNESTHAVCHSLACALQNLTTLQYVI